MPGSDIIVIGGSAGALEALVNIVRQLPRSLEAAVFVALHTGPSSEGVLPKILQRHGIMTARFPVDDEAFEYGQIYVAPPDQHLEVEGGKVRLFHGPRENGFRPAIDPLFRSAARAYDGRVTGVLLSGALDDGTFGLMSIKQGGGRAIVQHPYEASVPSLPMHAIQNVEVDHIVQSSEIGPLLVDLVRGIGPSHASVSAGQTATQQELAGQRAGGALEPQQSRRDVTLESQAPDTLPGQPSWYVCPECGGALFEVTDGQFRFRCHTGHGFTAQTLLNQQSVQLEHALWSAVRVLQERAALHRRMADQAEQRNIHTQVDRNRELAREQESKALILRELLEQGERPWVADVPD